MFPVVGIDTSHWKDGPAGEPLPDFAAGADQYSFGIPKITDGYKYGLGRPGLDDYMDPEFEHGYNSLGQLGKPRKVFHYFQSGTDGKKQAEIVYNALNKVGELPEMGIDLDVESNYAGVTINDFRNNLEKTVINLERLIPECEVGFYTSASKWAQFVANPINGPTDLVRLNNGNPRALMVANWGVIKPAIPWDWEHRFGTECYDLWQTGTMLLPGFKGYVDRNEAYGDTEWFENRYGVILDPDVEPPPPPPPPPDTTPAAVMIKGLLSSETLRLRKNIFGEIVAMTWNDAEFGVMSQAKDGSGRYWYQIGPSIWVAGWYCRVIE